MSNNIVKWRRTKEGKRRWKVERVKLDEIGLDNDIGNEDRIEDERIGDFLRVNLAYYLLIHFVAL